MIICCPWAYLDSANRDLAGSEHSSVACRDATSVMWNRELGRERFPNMWERQRACQQLEATLKLLGARQLVVGHTPQVHATQGLLRVLP